MPDIDHDELNELITDAIYDGEGRLQAKTLNRHLAKHGMKIIHTAVDEGQLNDKANHIVNQFLLEKEEADNLKFLIINAMKWARTI